MKPWIGVLVSLLVATACLVACGDSDDGPGVRNAALLTSDTAEVKVSSEDDSKEDSDYNDMTTSATRHTHTHTRNAIQSIFRAQM